MLNTNRVEQDVARDTPVDEEQDSVSLNFFAQSID